MKRLLLVAPYFLPRNYGGVPQVYHQLFSRLRTYDVRILSETAGGDPDAMADFDRAAPNRYGYRMVRFPRLSLHLPPGGGVLRNAVEAAKFFRQTAFAWDRLVAELQPDVVVCGATYSCSWLMTRLSRSVARVNYLHGEELTLHMGSGPLARLFRSRQRRAIRSADLNLAVSRYTAELAVRQTGAPEDRMQLHPNFVDTARFHPPRDRTSLRRELGWQDRLVLLTVARLQERKGIDRVLSVLRDLAGQSLLPRSWLYLIGGRGDEEARLREMAASPVLKSHVRFLGFIPDKELPSLYGAADVFVQTNVDVAGDTEGFGIVFLEASACGTAVLGGIAGGTADAIEESVSGLRVDGDNPQAIARALLRLLCDSTFRATLAQHGAARARIRFSLEAAVERFENLLASLPLR